MRRIACGFVLLLAVGAAVPDVAFAQTSGIAGIVRDPSGAVMPGVTVEASSPALIEQVRTVTTDTQGQYKIVDLRPGTYTVTFTLPGFSTVKREGIELPATFVATVNVELRVELEHQRGLIALLATSVNAADGNIEKISMDERDGRISVVQLVVSVHDRVHLASVIKKLRALKGVIRITRMRS